MNCGGCCREKTPEEKAKEKADWDEFWRKAHEANVKAAEEAAKRQQEEAKRQQETARDGGDFWQQLGN